MLVLWCLTGKTSSTYLYIHGLFTLWKDAYWRDIFKFSHAKTGSRALHNSMKDLHQLDINVYYDYRWRYTILCFIVRVHKSSTLTLLPMSIVITTSKLVFFRDSFTTTITQEIFIWEFRENIKQLLLPYW